MSPFFKLRLKSELSWTAEIMILYYITEVNPKLTKVNSATEINLTVTLKRIDPVSITNQNTGRKFSLGKLCRIILI